MDRTAICKFAMILPIAILVGCSPQKDQSGDSEQVHKITPPAGTETADVVNQADVYCADASDCNPAVGMMIEEEAEGIGTCTFFLVGADLAMTNGHCIPKGLQAGASCKGQIWLHFPTANGYQGEVIDCDSVVSVREDVKKSGSPKIDYAVLRLSQSTNRPFLKIGRSGFQDQKSFKVISMSPQSQTAAVGKVASQNCKAIHNTLMLDSGRGDYSDNMRLAECDVVHGNSGSPILDEKGNVVGVMQATTDAAAVATLLSLYQVPQVEPMSPMGIATNFSCVELPSVLEGSVSRVEKSKCETPLKDTPLVRDIQKYLLDRNSNLDQMFQWGPGKLKADSSLFGENKSRVKLALIPICIANPKENLKWYESVVLPKKKSVDVKFPVVTIVFGFDKYLREVLLEKGNNEFVMGRITYDVRQLMKYNKSPMTIFNEKGEVLAEETLQVCQ